MKILLTAFDPFGGEPVNPAEQTMHLVKAPAGVTLCKLTVPTVYGDAGEVLLQAMRREKPDAVLCLGQAAGRAAVTPERVAINVCDASIPDNAGNQPQDEPVRADGPAAYFSMLPVKAIVKALSAAGIPAAVSNTAGTFVCNYLMYSLLWDIDRYFPGVRGGFMHLPCIPEQLPRMPAGTSALPLETLANAVELTLGVINSSLEEKE